MKKRNSEQKCNTSKEYKLPSKEEFFSVLKEDEYVRNRMYNIRHGETEQTGDVPVNMGLKEGEYDRIKTEIAIRLINYGLNSDNTSINFAGRTARIRETAYALVDVLSLSEEKQSNYVMELDTIPGKYKNQPEKNHELLQLAASSSKFTLELMELLKDMNEGDNIINVIHKTNFSPIERTLNRKSLENIWLDIYGGIETNEIKELDFSDNMGPIDYGSRKDLLFLGDHNIDTITSLLEDDDKFQKAIKAYEEQEIQIYQLQNYVNYIFGKYPELYETYLGSDNENLRIFCLVNLLKLGNYTTIEDSLAKVIRNIDNESLEKSLKAIFDVCIDSKHYEKGEINPEYIDLLFRIIYTDEKVNNKLKVYFKKKCNDNQYILKRIDYYDNLMKNHTFNIQPEIGKIRNKSLDERFHTENSSKEIENNFNLGDKNIEENCLNILENNQTVYIEGDGGAGKSFFSVYLQEQLKKNHFVHKGKAYFPMFIQLSGKKWNDILYEIRKQTKYCKDNGQIVYFFESLDESEFCNGSGIKQFLEHIQKNNLKSIIITRAGYIDTGIYDTEKWNMKKYTIKGMKDPMKYVKDYFGGDEKKIRKYEEFQRQIGEKYIEQNSLFVTILCELTHGGGKNIESIDSKWKLFDAIVEQRLSKREGEKNGRKITVNMKKEDINIEKQVSNEIKGRSGILEKIAYLKHKNKGKIEEKDMDTITDMDIESLSFLFKKNDHGEYGFIHKSFENYFLLRYFKERPEALDEVRKKPQEPDNSRKGRLRRKLQELNILIDTGSADYVDYDDKENLLEITVAEGYIEMVEFLITQRYDINKKKRSGKTPFVLALESGRREMVRWLSDKVDNLEESGFKGKSAFILACEEGRLDMVQLLVDKKVNTNAKDMNGETGFMKACKKGELEIAQFLEDKIADINGKDSHGKTGFMGACSNGKLEVAQWLADKVNINERDNEGMTAFMGACMYGKLEIAERLLDKIDNINTKDNSGTNAFMRACFGGQLEVAQWLANKIDNINESDNDGNTAFIWACKSKNLELVQWLFDKVENINKKNGIGRTAFMGVCRNGRLEIAKWLEDKININEKDDAGDTAFILACEKGELETAQWLADRINNINEKDNSGRSAFLNACAAGKLKIVEWLAKKIEDINQEDNDGRNAFIRAGSSGRLELVKWLSDKVIDINKKDNLGMTAFMRANTGNKSEIVEWLSERVNINEKDNKGRTAFMRSCLCGKLGTKRWTWNKKININEKDNEGCTAFMWACLKGELQTARCIEREIEDINEKDNNGNTAFLWACRNGRLNVAQWLFDEKIFPLQATGNQRITLKQRLSGKKININEKNNEGRTAFMWACRNGELETAKWLSDQGANITEKDNIGMTALMLACLHGELDIVTWLADKVNIKKKDHGGMNAFMRACAQGNLEITKLLYNKLDNINEKDNDGKTAFMWACIVGNLEVIQWLSDKVNINEKDNLGMNAFICACKNGKLEAAKWLSDKVNINEKDNDGMNALIMACKFGELEIVKRLWDKIDINEKDNEGMTAFMRACIIGHVEIAEFLYDKIKDINQPNNYGLNALILAGWNGELEIIKWFSEKTKNVDEINGIIGLSLSCACKRGYIELAERSLKQIDNINAPATTVIDALAAVIIDSEENGQIEIVDMIQKRIEQLKQSP